jgi:hypothetical protein
MRASSDASGARANDTTSVRNESVGASWLIGEMVRCMRCSETIQRSRHNGRLHLQSISGLSPGVNESRRVRAYSELNPCEQSPGSRTPLAKQCASRNAWKGGTRVMLRRLARVLRGKAEAPSVSDVGSQASAGSRTDQTSSGARLRSYEASLSWSGAPVIQPGIRIDHHGI